MVLPLWNLTPLRRVMVAVRPSSESSVSAASTGSGWKLLLTRYSGS